MRRLLAIAALLATGLAATAGPAAGDPLVQDGFAAQTYGGGMLTDNGQLDWGVPANAAPFNLKLQYIEGAVNNYSPPNGLWIGNPFALRIYNFDVPGTLVTTDKPMTLTLHYTDGQLAGRDPSSLRVVKLSNVQWIDLPSTIDTARHVVTAETRESGDYGLLSGVIPTPTTAPAAAPTTAAQGPSGSSVISGQVFFDKDGNGVMDGEDFPVASAGVLLTSGNWYSFTRTGADGRYSFSGLSNGSYQANVAVGPEWAYTTPVSVSGLNVYGQAGSDATASFGIWYRVQ